ncbi:MAG: tRNA epoxyqueuosine(34) reductase QueG [Rhodoferax sp.]
MIQIVRHEPDPQWVPRLQEWGRALGFSQIGVAGVDLSSAEPGLLAWLAAGFHGQMHYMAQHGLKRARPAELVPGTVSVITARMDYLPPGTAPDWRERAWQRLRTPDQAVVSMYAQGRDYHKRLRANLQRLAQQLQDACGPLGHRVFCDSAPVLEVELASRSGLGWRGKHTLLLNRTAGSMFFLGEIYVDFALMPTPDCESHCGNCSACIEVCPTQAIVAPYRLDARRCISYLTIEHEGPVDLALRPLLGNHVYGCDDCQLVCPWNKFARAGAQVDFVPRHGLDTARLLDLWAWDESTFLQRTEGSAIRRIGFRRWRRNLSYALGNALRQAAPGVQRAALCTALMSAPSPSDPVLRDARDWALAQG